MRVTSSKQLTCRSYLTFTYGTFAQQCANFVLNGVTLNKENKPARDLHLVYIKDKHPEPIPSTQHSWLWSRKSSTEGPGAFSHTQRSHPSQQGALLCGALACRTLKVLRLPRAYGKPDISKLNPTCRFHFCPLHRH